jgi:hypothetical protein
MGIYVSLRPPNKNKHRVFIAAFLILATCGVIINIRQGKRADTAQSNLQKELNKIQTNTAPPAPIDIAADIFYPKCPAISLRNLSDRVATGLTWEMTLFRTNDLSITSLPTQPIGFLKSHSEDLPSSMFPQIYCRSDGPLKNGDDLIGSLFVDCPECGRGTTYIVHLVWGQSGWYVHVKPPQGGMIIPLKLNKPILDAYIQKWEKGIPDAYKMPIKVPTY